jgi:hypothetical protein
MLKEGKLKGHPAFWLENSHLSISVLPEKGADIYEFIHQPTGIDFLLKTPAGICPPGDQLPSDFLENYEGGWQELFPNPNEPYEYQGVTLPFHGEVALLPWDYIVERNDEKETAVRLAVECKHVPFRVERLMRLSNDSSVLEIEGRITNLSSRPEHFLWGHHIVLGGQFIENGCYLDIPARTLITPDKLYEPATARLAAGQKRKWPKARGRKKGVWFDLSEIPGPEQHSHDDVFLTDLKEGRLSVTNSRLNLRFWLDWDPNIFRVVMNWQPFGGADKPPLTGIYGLGVEPWVSRFGLAEAIRQGEAIVLDPGLSLSTRLLAGVTRAAR